MSNNENLTDINKELEDFFCGFLNLLYGFRLVNLNLVSDANYPSIDLGDGEKRICYQITSSNTPAKVRHTIEVFEGRNEHENYDELRFLFLKSTTDRFPRTVFKTNGKYLFEKPRCLIYVSDLLKEISAPEFEIDVLNEILEYTQARVDPLSNKNNITSQTVEIMLIKDLFTAISNSGLTVGQTYQELTDIDDADLKLKQDRFKDFWAFITEQYRQMATSNRERVFQTALQNYDETELIRLQEFFKQKSRELLLEEPDPVKAIDHLTTFLLEKIGPCLQSETEIKYFLYYLLFRCVVFPNPQTA